MSLIMEAKKLSLRKEDGVFSDTLRLYVMRKAVHWLLGCTILIHIK